MLKMLPALPMLNIDPALPMLRIEPALPKDKIDPALPMLRRLPMLMMLPTLPKLKMLSRLLALAKPARPLLKLPDDVRPFERMALCTAVSSVLARVSPVPLNMGSLAASSNGADLDGGGCDNSPCRLFHRAAERAPTPVMLQRWPQAGGGVGGCP